MVVVLEVEGEVCLRGHLILEVVVVVVVAGFSLVGAGGITRLGEEEGRQGVRGRRIR